MGACESLFKSSSSPTDKTNQISNNNPTNFHNNTNNIYKYKENGNFYRSPIGESSSGNKFGNNMSLTQSNIITENNNNSIYPTKKLELHKYVNKQNKNGYTQSNSVTGTLLGSSNTFSSIMSRNKEESKYSDYLSSSKSYGEFIIDNQINKKMEGDKDFNNFMKMNDVNIGDSGSIDDDKYKNNNKKDVNFYHKKNNKNSNSNEIKGKFSDEINNNIDKYKMPLDSE